MRISCNHFSNRAIREIPTTVTTFQSPPFDNLYFFSCFCPLFPLLQRILFCVLIPFSSSAELASAGDALEELLELRLHILQLCPHPVINGSRFSIRFTPAVAAPLLCLSSSSRRHLCFYAHSSYFILHFRKEGRCLDFRNFWTFRKLCLN